MVTRRVDRGRGLQGGGRGWKGGGGRGSEGGGGDDVGMHCVLGGG